MPQPTSPWRVIIISLTACLCINLPALAAPPLTGIVKVATSPNHFSCALNTAGGVHCWGSNSQGQLGNGSQSEAGGKVDVPGLSSGVADIAVGGLHACAVLKTGSVKCWGLNASSQLGDGSTAANRTSHFLATPTPVKDLEDAIAIALGDNHSCALTKTGKVKCWGNNDRGQLGLGDVKGVPLTADTPTEISSLSTAVKAVSAGAAHTCALTQEGGIKCWGRNLQVGDNREATSPDATYPVDVRGLTSDMVAVSAGGIMSCGLTKAGAVKCWGDNRIDILGDGQSKISNMPVQVLGLDSGIQAISVGHMHACSLDRNGAVKCWGLGFFGSLGDNYESILRPAPFKVAGLQSGVTSLSLGTYHSCSVDAEHRLKCWGDNRNNWLGTDTGKAIDFAPTPVGWSTGNNSFSITPAASRVGNLLGLSADFKFKASDKGLTGSLYVAAQLPQILGGDFYLFDGAQWVKWDLDPAHAVAVQTIQSLTAGGNVPILSGYDISQLSGVTLYAGYGRAPNAFAEMLASQTYATLYTIINP